MSLNIPAIADKLNELAPTHGHAAHAGVKVVELDVLGCDAGHGDHQPAAVT
jgi:hypothetical protein